MPYLFTCPECQTQTLVDDLYSGLKGQCVDCNASIAIPDFATPRSKLSLAGTRLISNVGLLRIVAAVFALVLLGCLLFVLVQGGSAVIAEAQKKRMRGLDMDNLRKIAAALNAYADDCGTYPISQRDDRGRPLHSWRVLILPYLGQSSMFNKYSLEKPWDDPVNLTACDTIPAVYRSSIGGQTGFALETSYRLVVGPGTLFPGRGQALGPKDLVDDPAMTILVVESAFKAGTTRLWSEPFDLDIRSMAFQIGSPMGTEMGGNHEGGAVVATVDGRSHFLKTRLTPQEIRGLLSPNGGEPLNGDVLD